MAEKEHFIIVGVWRYYGLGILSTDEPSDSNTETALQQHTGIHTKGSNKYTDNTNKISEHDGLWPPFDQAPRIPSSWQGKHTDVHVLHLLHHRLL